MLIEYLSHEKKNYAQNENRDKKEIKEWRCSHKTLNKFTKFNIYGAEKMASNDWTA